MHNTCAIVGNSGTLLNHSYGSLIDSHDFVIRINQPSIVSYEKYVGTKISMMSMNPQSYALNSTCPHSNVSIFINSKQNFHVCKRKNYIHALQLSNDVIMDTLRSSQFDLKLLFYKLKQPDITYEKLRYKPMMSGMWTIMISMYICKRISIFGITHLDSEHTTKYHYYSNRDKIGKHEFLSIEAFALTHFAQMHKNVKLY